MSTFRALLVLSFVLISSHSAEAQAVRYDYFASTTSAQCAPGKQCPLNVLPGTQVNICGGAIATFAACLASPSTTYTNSGAGTPCATTSQLTPATGGACRATADNQGGYGWWILPGSYNYFLRVPATAGGGTYGPFPLFIGASAGCPLGAACDANFSTIAAACSAAGSETLYVTRNWTATPSQTLSCGLQFLGNGKLTLAAGATVVIAGSLSAPVRQRLFDVSASGSAVSIAQPIDIYPEWWGAVAGQDSTAAFQAILNMISTTTNSMKLIIPNNNLNSYHISTTLTYTGASNFGASLVMEGVVAAAGGQGSILLWTGASGGVLIHTIDCHKCRINHIAFQGNALALTDFWLDASDTVGSTQSADDTFDDNSFSGMAGAGSAGLRISHTGCTNADVAEIAVRNSGFAGTGVSFLETGISYECGGNSKNITLDNNTIESLGTGIFVESSSFGWVNLLGTYFANNQIDMQVPLGALNIVGGGSEGSFKLADMGAGSNQCRLSMNGFYWSGNTISNDNIITTSGCSLDIANSVFSNGRTPSSIPKIIMSGGFPPIGCTIPACGIPSLTSHGNFFINADKNNGAYYDNGGSPLGVYYGTYAANSVNTNQMQIQAWGDYGGVAENDPVALPNYSFAQPRIMTPASPTSPCTPPQITYDTAGNQYLCTALNTWVNAAGARLSAPAGPTSTLTAPGILIDPAGTAAYFTYSNNQTARVDLSKFWTSGAACTPPIQLTETGSSANDALVVTSGCFQSGGPITNGTMFSLVLGHSMSANHAYNTMAINAGSPLNIITHFGTGGGGSGATAYAIGGTITLIYFSGGGGYFVDISQ